MSFFDILTIGLVLIGVGVLGFTVWNTFLRKQKGLEKTLETEYDLIPKDSQPFIHFSGGKFKVSDMEGSGQSYHGYVVGGKTDNKGNVIARVHDLMTGSVRDIGPMIWGQNIDVVPSADMVFGKNTLKCNIDFNNQPCEWDVSKLEAIKLELARVTEARIKEDAKQDISDMMEWVKTRGSSEKTITPGELYNQGKDIE